LEYHRPQGFEAGKRLNFMQWIAPSEKDTATDTLEKRLAWPPAKILAKAREILEPMSQQIIALKRQIQNPRHTRDLLLPRLLSGQVELKTEAA
jgi:hypothetical protein